MAKNIASAPTAFRPFTPTAFEGSTRLSFRRLRRPTPLPGLVSESALGRYLDRLNWLFGGR
jgi:hypothetical protein